MFLINLYIYYFFTGFYIFELFHYMVLYNHSRCITYKYAFYFFTFVRLLKHRLTIRGGYGVYKLQVQ